MFNRGGVTCRVFHKLGHCTHREVRALRPGGLTRVGAPRACPTLLERPGLGELALPACHLLAHAKAETGEHGLAELGCSIYPRVSGRFCRGLVASPLWDYSTYWFVQSWM